jgi:hypothetical protein
MGPQTPKSPLYNSEILLKDFWECPSCKTRFPCTGMTTEKVQTRQNDHFRDFHGFGTLTSKLSS